MLRTRLWMGTLLALFTLGALLIDGRRLAPWYPFLLLLLVGLGLMAGHEFRQMIERRYRPPAWICYGAVVALALANWPAHLWWPRTSAWSWIALTFAAVVLIVFLEAMANFDEGAGVAVIVRMALAVFLAAYLGLLPCFLAQMRWPVDINANAEVALTLAIFVPKCCDIGAYFTGRFLGRHKMTPQLSPKKTWEGLAGGLLLAVIVAVGVNRLGPTVPPLLGSTDLGAVAFGLTVGGAGVLGDLAESLIKRACQQKDASQVVPGFGGVLDVIDSVVFAAPVAYVWLS